MFTTSTITHIYIVLYNHVDQVCVNSVLQPDTGAGGEEGGEGGTGEPEEEVVYKYIPPIAKDWVSQGSEKEIAEESLVEHRPKVNKLILNTNLELRIIM